MTNDEIELFVDRLCGYWPTTNIARNTVKSTWKQSMTLRDLHHKQAKVLLERIKTMPGFPSLNVVEQQAKGLMKRDKQTAVCTKCDGCLWLYVEPKVVYGLSYRQVVKCTCYGGVETAAYAEAF